MNTNIVLAFCTCDDLLKWQYLGKRKVTKHNPHTAEDETMIQDFDDFHHWTYVVVDDIWEEIGRVIMVDPFVKTLNGPIIKSHLLSCEALCEL